MYLLTVHCHYVLLGKVEDDEDDADDDEIASKVGQIVLIIVSRALLPGTQEEDGGEGKEERC